MLSIKLKFVEFWVEKHEFWLIQRTFHGKKLTENCQILKNSFFPNCEILQSVQVCSQEYRRIVFAFCSHT
jgi:hypothetical protein